MFRNSTVNKLHYIIVLYFKNINSDFGGMYLFIDNRNSVRSQELTLATTSAYEQVHHF